MRPLQPASGDGGDSVGWWRAWSGRLVAVAATLASSATVSILLARTWWLFEVLSHFRVQAFVALSACAVALFVGGRPKLAVGCVLFAAINLGLILPLYLGGGEGKHAGKPRLRLLTFNAFGQNPQYDRTLELIRAIDPDIALLMEVTPGLSETLDPLKPDYTFTRFRAEPGSFGIGFLSRIPVEDSRIVEIGEPDKPAMVVRLRYGDRPLTVIGAHTMPPKGRSGFLERNTQLADLGSLSDAHEGAVIVMGDLNVTSWSPFFADLLSAGGLRDSRVGFGVQPTWPARNPLLRIPIDHVLVSEGVSVHARGTGPYIGSDHLAVICEISLAE
jgi:endonuclease/exonuclease/phosphatase (EEP) superfamily protein YafD